MLNYPYASPARIECAGKNDASLPQSCRPKVTGKPYEGVADGRPPWLKALGEALNSTRMPSICRHVSVQVLLSPLPRVQALLLRALLNLCTV